MKTDYEKLMKALKEVKRENASKNSTKKEKPQNESYEDALYTEEDWLEYYEEASRSELRANLRRLGDNYLTGSKKNERYAIRTLLGLAT